MAGAPYASRSDENRTEPWLFLVSQPRSHGSGAPGREQDADTRPHTGCEHGLRVARHYVRVLRMNALYISRRVARHFTTPGTADETRNNIHDVQTLTNHYIHRPVPVGK